MPEETLKTRLNNLFQNLQQDTTLASQFAQNPETVLGQFNINESEVFIEKTKSPIPASSSENPTPTIVPNICVSAGEFGVCASIGVDV
ncbi:MAG: hypothetical protein ACTHJ5_13265 [Ilyomonas sp.]